MSEDTPVNTGVVWPEPDGADYTVRRMQIKLHRWVNQRSRHVESPVR